MGLLLYSAEFLRPLPDDAFQQLLHRLPVEGQSTVLRYRRWQDAHATLLGKHLLLLALERIGSPLTLEQIHYTPERKPFFPGGPNFNISHSGNRVVCGLSTNGRVGVDIEFIKPISFEDFQTQFTPKEWTAIRGASDPVAAFYRFWTAKESLIKADGRGLGIPLLDLDVTEYKPVPLDGATWTFQILNHFPGYAGHVTTEDANPGISLHEIAPAAIAAAL
jgi:4'-phosphopantetheinyl transferase